MTHLAAAIDALKTYARQQVLPTPETTTLFRRLLPDALEQATRKQADGSYFVATGDLPAMWLRDATFQILPYVTLIPEIPALYPIVSGVLKRELRYITIDPYANAFNETASGAHWAEDQSDVAISPWVWERKFEVDSLLAPLLLAEKLYEVTGDERHFDDEFWTVYERILAVLKTEQHHETSPYIFHREDCAPNDTLPNQGRGELVGDTGLVWSGFRPSDNTCVLGYHIPDNYLAADLLMKMSKHLPIEHATLRRQNEQLLSDIRRGIEQYATVVDDGEKRLAYEVDGLGRYLLMDDANVPSLLALPFLTDLETIDPIYLATRAFILSMKNPYYYAEKVLQGIGSEHTPPHYIWPLSLLMEGLTTSDRTMQLQKLQQVATTHAGTYQCHEGIDGNDVTHYTREWFSWANMTYCQLALAVLMSE
ncbi:MAG: glycoside hydrolase family 125 protein [Aerococcus sp.]|nr:glycoside hydrolase family 125 protein [Aerococcus sp.]